MNGSFVGLVCMIIKYFFEMKGFVHVSGSTVY